MSRKKIIGLLLCAALTIPVFAQESVLLTSLDWPPYTAAALPGQGLNAVVVRAAFKAMGYELSVQFYPWNRAVALVQNDKTVMGYFPEYYSDANAADFIYSDPIGIGPLGFVERSSDPVVWTALKDLANVKIGVVSGYINTEEFDAMVAKKQLQVNEVSSDTVNILNVGNGRISLAVIDPNVLDWLLVNDPSLAAVKNKVRMNSRLLENKNLYICFKKSPEGEKWMKILNQGLKKIDVDKITKDYFASLNTR